MPIYKIVLELFVATKQDAEEGLKKCIRIPVRPLDEGTSVDDCVSGTSSDGCFRKVLLATNYDLPAVYLMHRSYARA